MYKKHYYLVASLPHLSFEKGAPISREGFLFECEKWLDEKESAGLLAADINGQEPRSGDSAVVREWKEFVLTLRRELAGVRRARREGGRERVPVELKDVFEARTPLDMEREIEKKRWRYLDEAESGFHFDMNVLTVYFLKLQILERLAAFDREKGSKIYEDLCEVRYEHAVR